MNMYRHELRMYRSNTILWMVALVGIAGVFMSFYPIFAAEAEPFKELLRSMPQEVMAAFGLQIDSITSLLGFYSYVCLYISLLGAIQAIHLGASMMSAETRAKTADFLLTKPVTRGAVLRSKALAALTLLCVTQAVYFAASTALAFLVQREAFSYTAFALINASLLLTQLVFLSLGFAAALLLPRLKTVLPLSLGVVFSLFMLSAVGASSGDGGLRYLTPFQYFDRMHIVWHERYEPEFLVAGAAVIALCVWFSVLRCLKRDVHAS
ncbi:ABC transporter permease [Paenibacillus sp. PL2-23]|uniref:ABC transporter permease n=1 Tax=Paenibacillus sp. PL2-23 TaxID=2100729 RepID=UPI0030F9B9D5